MQERHIDECLTLSLPEIFRASASSWFPTEYSICNVSISSIYEEWENKPVHHTNVLQTF